VPLEQDGSQYEDRSLAFHFGFFSEKQIEANCIASDISKIDKLWPRL